MSICFKKKHVALVTVGLRISGSKALYHQYLASTARQLRSVKRSDYIDRIQTILKTELRYQSRTATDWVSFKTDLKALILDPIITAIHYLWLIYDAQKPEPLPETPDKMIDRLVELEVLSRQTARFIQDQVMQLRWIQTQLAMGIDTDAQMGTIMEMGYTGCMVPLYKAMASVFKSLDQVPFESDFQLRLSELIAQTNSDQRVVKELDERYRRDIMVGNESEKQRGIKGLLRLFHRPIIFKSKEPGKCGEPGCVIDYISRNGQVYDKDKLSRLFVDCYAIRRDNKTQGYRRVARDYGIYFKEMPSAPPIEYAVEMLMQLLVGRTIPATDLLHIQTRNGEWHLVQVSQRVDGDNLKDLFDRNEDDRGIDCVIRTQARHLSLWVIGCIVLRCADYKPDNLIKNKENQIEGIDNDHAMFLEHKRLKSGLMKNILFCSQAVMDAGVNGDAKKWVSRLPIYIMFNEWLTQIKRMDTQTKRLFEGSYNGMQSMREYGEKHQRGDRVVLDSVFHSDSIKRMYYQLWKLKRLWNQTGQVDARMSHGDLLVYLDSEIARIYRENIGQSVRTADRFHQLIQLERDYERNKKTGESRTVTLGTELYTRVTGYRQRLRKEHGSIVMLDKLIDELRLIDHHWNRVGPICIELSNPEPDRIREIIEEIKRMPVEFIEDVMMGLNWDKCCNDVKKEMVDVICASRGLTCLMLENCEYLTNTKLIKVLGNNKESITVINITGCHQITDEGYGLIRKTSVVDKIHDCEWLQDIKCDDWLTNRLNEYRETVLEDVRNNLWINNESWKPKLKTVSRLLRNDQEVVFDSVKDSPWDLEYASTALKSNKAFILRVLNFQGWLLKYASDELKKDKEVVLFAVKNNGLALEYASAKLRDDKEVVLFAVKNTGTVLEYASAKLRDNKDVVLAAVKESGWALEYASAELRNDKTVVLAAVKKTWESLRFLPESFKRDRDIVLAATICHKQSNSSPWACYPFQWAHTDLRNDKEFVRSIVKENPLTLKYASAILQNDKEIVLAAVKRYGGALDYASKNLRHDPDVKAATGTPSFRLLGRSYWIERPKEN